MIKKLAQAGSAPSWNKLRILAVNFLSSYDSHVMLQCSFFSLSFSLCVYFAACPSSWNLPQLPLSFHAERFPTFLHITSLQLRSCSCSYRGRKIMIRLQPHCIESISFFGLLTIFCGAHCENFNDDTIAKLVCIYFRLPTIFVTSVLQCITQVLTS